MPEQSIFALVKTELEIFEEQKNKLLKLLYKKKDKFQQVKKCSHPKAHDLSDVFTRRFA